ncbi:hypothetical protein ACVDFE_21155 [Lentzea chajnantorensis]
MKQAQHANLVRAVTDDVVLFDPVEDLPALVGKATGLETFAPDADDPVRGARHAVIRHAWAQRRRDGESVELIAETAAELSS